jgi:hypothetical protein
MGARRRRIDRLMAGSAVVVLLSGTTAVAATHGGDIQLNPYSGQQGSGTAQVEMVEDDQLRVMIEASGLDDGATYGAYLRTGGDTTCPTWQPTGDDPATTDDDGAMDGIGQDEGEGPGTGATNGNQPGTGVTDDPDAQGTSPTGDGEPADGNGAATNDDPDWGDVQVALTTDGDTDAGAAGDTDRFHTAENGSISYERTIEDVDEDVRDDIRDGNALLTIERLDGPDGNGNGDDNGVFNGDDNGNGDDDGMFGGDTEGSVVLCGEVGGTAVAGAEDTPDGADNGIGNDTNGDDMNGAGMNGNDMNGNGEAVAGAEQMPDAAPFTGVGGVGGIEHGMLLAMAGAALLGAAGLAGRAVRQREVESE